VAPNQPARAERKGKAGAWQAVYGNPRRIRGRRGKSLMHKTGKYIERSFGGSYEEGGTRRKRLGTRRLRQLAAGAAPFFRGFWGHCGVAGRALAHAD